MTDKAQDVEFMKQYMDTCKEQIERLARDPELLSQTLKPFMQMSQQLMASSVLDGDMTDAVPSLDTMNTSKMIAKINEMIEYIKSNYKEIIKSDNLKIQDLDKSSRKLRVLIRKLVEKVEANR